ncbi:MAG: TetR family transcriptional regulator [Actinomycetota bacterium]
MVSNGAADQSGPKRLGRPPSISRDRIVATALELGGREGLSALTMRRLADELGVTVRALYRHVEDRQEVIDLLAYRFLEDAPPSLLDVDDWRDSLRAHAHEVRRYYGRYPRLLLISLDEKVTPRGVHPRRIELTEELLAFLTSIGLALPDALAIRTQFLLDAFAFALLMEYPASRASAEAGAGADTSVDSSPVPEEWLDHHDDVDAEHSRAAAELPDNDLDREFDQIVDNLLAAIDARRAG